MIKISFMLMQSQDHNLFRNVYFHYIISNTIFKRNIRGPKNGPFLESILHLFVRPLHNWPCPQGYLPELSDDRRQKWHTTVYHFIFASTLFSR